MVSRKGSSCSWCWPRRFRGVARAVAAVIAMASGAVVDVKSTVTRVAVPVVSPADASKLAADNRAFAADLHGVLRAQSGNLVYSPASVSVGAGDVVRRGSWEHGHRDCARAPLRPSAATSARGLRGVGAGPGKAGRQSGRLSTDGGERPMGPARLPLPARLPGPPRRELRRWHSHGGLCGCRSRPARPSIDGSPTTPRRRSTTSFPPESSMTTTRLVLTNAVYFKGDWYHPFAPNSAEQLSFIPQRATCRCR